MVYILCTEYEFKIQAARTHAYKKCWIAPEMCQLKMYVTYFLQHFFFKS